MVHRDAADGARRDASGRRHKGGTWIELPHNRFEQVRFADACDTFDEEALPISDGFNVEVWKQYVESPPIPALVFEAHEVFGNPMLLDIKQCRANALKESPFDFPVFSPLDSVEKAEEKLYDLAYIDREIAI